MTISTWTPVSRDVASITRANQAVVTTTEAHGYLAGTIVGFFFPDDFGMNSLEEQNYLITVLSPTTFSIDVNTSNFDSFNPSVGLQVAQVYPAGETANTLANRERNTLTPVGGNP